MASPISYKTWAHSSPQCIAFLIHGLGANSSWWEEFAQFLLKNNISSYAIDLRRHTSFKEFFLLINELLAIIKKDNPGKKIFAVGESMGSLIILAMALKDKAVFDGLACISPAFNSRAPLKPFDYVKIFLPLLYNPEKKYRLPVTSDMCTRDPAYLKMIETTYDKDVLSTSRVLFDIFIAQISMRIFGMKIGVPILFLVAGDDKLVYSDASIKVFKKISAKDKNIIEYPGMYHSLSIDTGREKVFADILNWMTRRI
ncbi:MAG: alpha/beta fold hydrolase [Candidatus Omnitrophota bacterium]|nr:alpha/beta fold hydrolase [Candidatus Omnitrophota bacterium]